MVENENSDRALTGRKAALPGAGAARHVPDGTGVRHKAAYVALTEEHVAISDKLLSGVFFELKNRPENGPRTYLAGTRSGWNGTPIAGRAALARASDSAVISIASR